MCLLALAERDQYRFCVTSNISDGSKSSAPPQLWAQTDSCHWSCWTHFKSWCFGWILPHELLIQEPNLVTTIHYNDVIMGAIASQITSLTIVYSIVYSGTYQRKHQSSASLAFVRGIHRGPVNSPHKWPVTRKMFPFDDIIMTSKCPSTSWC